MTDALQSEHLFDPDRAPYVKGSETSKEAAEAIKPLASAMRKRVFRIIERWGPLPDQKIAEISQLPENSVRPRRVELERAGLIVHDGYAYTASGRRAKCWRASE